MLIVMDGGATIDAFPSSASLFKSVSIAPAVPPEQGSRYCLPPLVTVLHEISYHRQVRRATTSSKYSRAAPTVTSVGRKYSVHAVCAYAAWHMEVQLSPATCIPHELSQHYRPIGQLQNSTSCDPCSGIPEEACILCQPNRLHENIFDNNSDI